MNISCLALPPHKFIVRPTDIYLPMGVAKKEEPNLTRQPLRCIAYCIVSAPKSINCGLIAHTEAVRGCHCRGNIVQRYKFVVQVYPE